MEDKMQLNSAKRHIREGRILDGVRELLELVDQGSAEAPNLLGMLHSLGMGVAKDPNEAKRFFQISHERGNDLGTYHLAGQRHFEGDIQSSYDLYRSVADTNPSAAYWTFRCLEQLSSQRTEQSLKYLDQAASMGHVEAIRGQAIRMIKGDFGLKKVPLGIIAFFKVVGIAQDAIMKKEKFKYIDSVHRLGIRHFIKRTSDEQIS